MNDMFNLESFLFESESEFEGKNPATNPTVDWSKDGVSGTETSISVPEGGPSGSNKKNYDERSIPVPDGGPDGATKKLHDDRSISVPAATTLTADQYNQALSMLKKSFKEAVDVMEILENSTILNKSIEDLQDEYTEAAMDEAILATYDDGPIFEAVKREDKHDLKKVVKSLRGKIAKDLKSSSMTAYTPGKVLSFVRNTGGNAVIKNHTWQVVGGVSLAKGGKKELKSLLSELNSKYKSELSGYKILSVSIQLAGGKIKGVPENTSLVALIIDKKIPSDTTDACPDGECSDEKEDKSED